MGSGWAGVPCIIGPTARSACTRSIACWASRCCNTCIGRPKRHGPASRWRTCWKSCVRSRNLSCSTPRKVTRGQTGSPPCSPNRRCRSKPWPKRWAWSNCVLPRVGNTADRSQPVTKTRPYAFVLALPSKLPLAPRPRLQERPLLELLERLPELLLSVHHDRAVPRHGLLKRPSRDQEEPYPVVAGLYHEFVAAV